MVEYIDIGNNKIGLSIQEKAIWAIIPGRNYEGKEEQQEKIIKRSDVALVELTKQNSRKQNLFLERETNPEWLKNNPEPKVEDISKYKFLFYIISSLNALLFLILPFFGGFGKTFFIFFVCSIAYCCFYAFRYKEYKNQDLKNSLWYAAKHDNFLYTETKVAITPPIPPQILLILRSNTGTELLTYKLIFSTDDEAEKEMQILRKEFGMQDLTTVSS